MINVNTMFDPPYFTRDEETKTITLNAPVFLSCGCGSITARLSSVLQFINMSSRELNIVKVKQHQVCRDWLKQEGLYDKIPLLNQHTFGVLISNKKVDGEYKWADVAAGTTTKVAEKFKEILDVK